MARHLVMVGGGHAHVALMPLAQRLVGEGSRVTLVSPDPVHYYSGMGPGMLGGSYTAEESRFPVAELARSAGVDFVQARVSRVHAVDRTLLLSTGAELGYDVLSLNVGSSIAPTISVDKDAGPTVLPVKPIANLLEVQRLLLERGDEGSAVLVAGGGPAAVECAVNTRKFVRSISAEADERTSVELLTGSAVLPGFPRGVDRRVRRSLSRQRISVSPGEYVSGVTAEGVATPHRTIQADLVLQATGVVPSRLFADSGLPTGRDGSLAVNARLQCLSHHEIFGAGDCIWFTPRPLSRAGVFAVRQTPVLGHNLSVAMGGPGALRSFAPQRGYMLLLNMGDGTAVFWRSFLGVPLTVRGRWAWRLKDRIDRTFMVDNQSEASYSLQVADDGAQ